MSNVERVTSLSRVVGLRDTNDTNVSHAEQGSGNGGSGASAPRQAAWQDQAGLGKRSERVGHEKADRRVRGADEGA